MLKRIFAGLCLVALFLNLAASVFIAGLAPVAAYLGDFKLATLCLALSAVLALKAFLYGAMAGLFSEGAP